MSTKKSDTELKTRVIPGLNAEYEIVSLPYWAWYWLDDYLQETRLNYRSLYRNLGQDFFREGEVTDGLIDIAEYQYESFIRESYQLANDNNAAQMSYEDHLKREAGRKKSYNKETKNLPKIYKLFGFMPCATTLEAVWERRHYKDSNRVK